MGASYFCGDDSQDATRLPANPKEWSVESQRSTAAEFAADYCDKSYSCWRCKALAF